MPDEYPQPPFDMDMPQTAEKIATFGLWIPATAMFIASLYWWKRSGSPVYFLGMLGGLLASCNEPIADILVHCYHAEVDQQWTVFSSFGRDIPLWAVGCYPVYFGGLSLLIYTLFRRGVTYRGYWIGVGIVIAGNLAFELPILAADMYLYYGDQPYEIAGFPVLLGVLNALGAVFGAFVLAVFSDQLRGRMMLLIPVIPSMTMLAAYGPVIPHMLTLNSDASQGVKYVGATIGILACLLVIDGIGRYAVKRFPAGLQGKVEPLRPPEVVSEGETVPVRP